MHCQTLLLLTVCLGCVVGLLPDWPMWGQNPANTRRGSSKITTHNVKHHTTLRWQLLLDGDVTATPTIWQDHIYIPTYGQSLYKIHALTGQIIWQTNFTSYTDLPGSYSRNSPAINKHGILVLGDQLSATLVGVDSRDGSKVWSTVLETHPAAIITTSATLEGNTAYVGVSSREEGFAANPAYACCSFRGSAVAVDILTGTILWQRYFIPASLTGVGKYSGCSVWGSGPAVDHKQVCIGTSNMYAAPESARQCELCRLGNCSTTQPTTQPTSQPTSPQEIDYSAEDTDSCVDTRVLFDAMVCMNKQTGVINWARRTELYDTWNVGCQRPGFPNCPPPVGPDAAYGQAPILIGTRVGAGQKSGIYWLRHRNNGRLDWATVAGPGSERGGIMWGSAYDCQTGHIYTAVSNGNYQHYTMVNGQNTTAGIWTALDHKRGTILWQTADPAGFNLPGALTSSGDVLFGGSMHPSGPMYALDGLTGEVVWNFTSGGSVHSGPAVVGNWIYWGNGYTRLGGTRHTGLFAFEVENH